MKKFIKIMRQYKAYKQQGATVQLCYESTRGEWFILGEFKTMKLS